MDARIEILKKFKKGLVACIDELITQFPNEGDLITIRVFIADQAPIEDVINDLALHFLPYKQMIIDRNEDFFLKDSDIFDMLNTTKVVHFKELWNSDQLDEDDKDAMWKWFKYLLNIIEDYQRILIPQVVN